MEKKKKKKKMMMMMMMNKKVKLDEEINMRQIQNHLRELAAFWTKRE